MLLNILSKTFFHDKHFKHIVFYETQKLFANCAQYTNYILQE